MNLKKAIAIVLTIEENEASYEEKVWAIKLVSETDTLNSITKKVILKAVNWLINNTFEWDGKANE